MIYQGIQVLASGDSAGVSPSLATLGIIVSILASLATVGTVLIMLRQERRQAESRDDTTREQAEARLAEYMKFRDDFYGDHRPGMPVVPGVREWMLSINTKVEQVLSEVMPNHGSSIKDAVTRMDNRLEKVETDVEGLHKRLDKV